MKVIRRIAMLAALAFAVGCSNETVEVETQVRNNVVGGSIESLDGVTRVVADESTLTGGTMAFSWLEGDAIGVFTNANEKNVKYTNTTGNVASNAKFMATASVSGTPLYAYYPYSAGAGNDYTSLAGSLEDEQEIASLNEVPGLVRWGSHKSTENGLSTFGFKNVFSVVRYALDPTSTRLAGLRLKSVQIKVVRNFFSAVPIVGDYTFNASTGAYTTSGTSNIVTYNFKNYPKFDGTLTFVSTLLPKIKKYDRIYFTVVTAGENGETGSTASFYVTSSVTMSANNGYTFNLAIKSGKSLSVKSNKEVYEEPEDDTTGDDNTGDNGDDNTGNEGDGGNTGGDDNTGDDNTGDDNTGEGGDNGNTGDGDDNGDVPTAPVEPDPTPEPEPEPEPTPEVVTGNFTCATYNVDGLPKKISFITINGDGPGSDGTKNISSAIANQGWDFVGFSEDFAYHSELTSAMGGYTFGTHRGSVSSISSNNTDGLGFASKNATCSFGSTESWTQFSSSYGGITSGANTCIKKGFRHYVVTMADGVEVDVIVTHMNTYSSSGSNHINAQHAQLKQIAQYINTISANGRPIIFMGDTNCRYTRHDFNTYFWSVLNSDLTYADPWVDFQWNGVYPTYPSKSLMVSDATGTDSSTDIICADTQQGEVVDKVIYINKASNKVQLKAKSYLRDYDKFNGLADHMPIVVEFEYSYKK